MDDSATAEQVRRWGLCATCMHARVVPTDRGAVFVQCGRAAEDSQYRRYPIVPVRGCDGFVPPGRASAGLRPLRP